MNSSAITTGDSVKDQINSTISGVQGQISNLKSQVVGQLDNVDTTYEPIVRTIDNYRCGGGYMGRVCWLLAARRWPSRQ